VSRFPRRLDDFVSLFAPHADGTGAALSPTMDAIEAQLEVAEFEALWLEVNYHEHGATVAEVERAISRVNRLRGLADRMADARMAGETLSWNAPAPLPAFGH
jgi:hypothetical protein